MILLRPHHIKIPVGKPLEAKLKQYLFHQLPLLAAMGKYATEHNLISLPIIHRRFPPGAIKTCQHRVAPWKIQIKIQ
jgi:hypothetical protein